MSKSRDNDSRFIELTHEEVFMLFVSSVRYALGRSTYIVEETCRTVQRHAPRLSVEQRAIVLRDIERELDRAAEAGHEVGMKMDTRRWTELASFLRTLKDSPR